MVKVLVIDDPRYQCFAAGCPANHASKRDLCEDPVISRLRALGQHPGMFPKGQRDCEDAIKEVVRLRSALLQIYQRTEHATLHGAAVDAHAIAKAALSCEHS
jgi:hypothetical protein